MSGPPIGVFSLFRLPLGYFQPHDLLYVYEHDGHIAGLVRVERETVARRVDDRGARRRRRPDAGDIRFRLVQHLLRDGAKRGAARFHVACADADGNVELFMQAGFMRYGEERVLFRPRRPSLRQPWSDEARRRRGIRPARRSTRCRSPPLRGVTPQPVQRLEAIRLPDWERQGTHWRVPRSSAWRPILRFADVEAFVQQSPGGGSDGTAARRFVQVGVAKEDQPHYLKLIARPDADVVRLVDFGLGVIAARTRRRRPSPRSRRPRTRPNLRGADRPAPGGGRLRLDRHGHAAHEGNPRPRRRAGPRAGRRPLAVEGGSAWDPRGPPARNDRRPRRPAGGPAAGDRRRGPRPARPRVAHRGRHGPRPPAGGPLPRLRGRLLEREINEADIAYVVEHIGTFGDDNRAGIERTLHRISAIRNRNGKVVGLTCRIGRAVYGTIEIINDFVESGKSILIMGRPGIGKTTMLREAARVLADDMRKRVVVVDTSNEIAGDGDIPHPAIGKARRMQVRTRRSSTR